MTEPKQILVTGAAGFIGFHVARALLARGDRVAGLDNLSSYYDPALKRSRLEQLQPFEKFEFIEIDVANRPGIEDLFKRGSIDQVVHLAAQAGVRYSLENPYAYAESNLSGFLNILEGCRWSKVRHLVYASSSSVYGANAKLPFSEHDNVDHPVSLYAATKKANELMAHAYASLFRFPATGLRFFTVYGPWGRPDMALFRFTKGILEGTPIEVYNEGRMMRDFTYIDDVVEGVVRILDLPAEPDSGWNSQSPDPATSYAPFRIFNIGNHRPVQLLDYIRVIEECAGRKAILKMLPLQPGDVLSTEADVAELAQAIGYEPSTPVEKGVRKFVEWYREYYGV